MNTTSPPKTSLVKLGLCSKVRSLRVLVLGQSGVGKTALVVRFVTSRFIGEYESNLEKVYTTNTVFDKEAVQFDILDAANRLDQQENENCTLENNVRWADAYILVYSVTDKCSFDECNRLRFLINYNKRRRKLVAANNSRDLLSEIPVVLVGNKTDQFGERMVSIEEGQRRFKELSCACFHEISVRESVDQVQAVFRDVFRFWRVFSKFPKLKRSTSDIDHLNAHKTPPNFELEAQEPITPEIRRSLLILGGSQINKLDHHSNKALADRAPQVTEQDSSFDTSSVELLEPFRSRASTDGTLLSRPRRWRYPPPGYAITHSIRAERRMSISVRGSNSSY